MELISGVPLHTFSIVTLVLAGYDRNTVERVINDKCDTCTIIPCRLSIGHKWEIEHGLCACTERYPRALARGLIDRTGAQAMLYLACTTISSVDLAQYGVSLAKDWVSVECGTSD